jgi:hypothetical protein
MVECKGGSEMVCDDELCLVMKPIDHGVAVMDRERVYTSLSLLSLLLLLPLMSLLLLMLLILPPVITDSADDLVAAGNGAADPIL